MEFPKQEIEYHNNSFKRLAKNKRDRKCFGDPFFLYSHFKKCLFVTFRLSFPDKPFLIDCPFN